jgi:hypothetical protein
MSVVLDPDLDERIRESAARSRKTLSEWLAEAAKAKLAAEHSEEVELQRKMRGLDRFLEGWQAEHGAFTDEEMAETSREMGLPWPPAAKRGHADAWRAHAPRGKSLAREMKYCRRALQPFGL